MKPLPRNGEVIITIKDGIVEDWREIKRGRWIDGKRIGFDETYHWFRQCAECLYEREDDMQEKDTNYCPNCGALMLNENDMECQAPEANGGKQATEFMVMGTPYISNGGEVWNCDAKMEEAHVLPSAESEWNNHTVACLLAEMFGDDCACNCNGIDEWLPEKCEVIDSCPNTVGVVCWEQFLKHRKGKQ